jgi:hypothetical protein
MVCRPNSALQSSRSLWGSVNRKSILECFFITITYPLHVSAPTGHLQVEYIYWLIPTDSLFLFRLPIVYIYILVFCFGDFFAAVSMYVVDMIAYYIVTFSILSYYIKINYIKIN